MMVLDTHVWLWWIDAPEKLSAACKGMLENAVIHKGKVFVSVMSVWELSMLVEKKRIELSITPRDWVRKCENWPILHFVPLDNTIILRSFELPGVLHADPADRFIAATALTLGVPLLTKDEKLIEYSHLKTIW